MSTCLSPRPEAGWSVTPKDDPNIRIVYVPFIRNVQELFTVTDGCRVLAYDFRMQVPPMWRVVVDVGQELVEDGRDYPEDFDFRELMQQPR